MRIKPIETVYNGYRFRSRLEARWAVFFDSLDVEYQYEPEGLDLNGTWYLPDFWLPQLKQWIEIKPIYPTDQEIKKAKLLLRLSGYEVNIIYGDIWPDKAFVLDMGIPTNMYKEMVQHAYKNNHYIYNKLRQEGYAQDVTEIQHLKHVLMDLKQGFDHITKTPWPYVPSPDGGGRATLYSRLRDFALVFHRFDFPECTKSIYQAFIAARQARFDT